MQLLQRKSQMQADKYLSRDLRSSDRHDINSDHDGVFVATQ
jgi:hypothetical protein